MNFCEVFSGEVPARIVTHSSGNHGQVKEQGFLR